MLTRFLNIDAARALIVAGIAVTLIASVAIGLAMWRSAIRSERDQWWRAELARASSAVKEIVVRGAAEAEATW